MDAVSSKRILIVEDEKDVVDLLSLNLRKVGGFAVSSAADGATGLIKAREAKPDLIILDLMLPKMSGLEICKILKTDQATRHIPVLMLTAKAEEIDRVLGLELGADDYVVKPFSPRELASRVRAILRRASPAGDVEQLDFVGLHIDLTSREVRVEGRPVGLTTREFDLLAFLASSPRRVYSRGQLLERVWSSALEWQDPATVTEHVRRI